MLSSNSESYKVASEGFVPYFGNFEDDNLWIVFSNLSLNSFNIFKGNLFISSCNHNKIQSYIFLSLESIISIIVNANDWINSSKDENKIILFLFQFFYLFMIYEIKIGSGDIN